MSLGCLYPRGPVSRLTVMPVQLAQDLMRGRASGGVAFVILRSEATKNPKPLCDCYVCILTNETRSLHIESVDLICVALNAERSGALDSSPRSE